MNSPSSWIRMFLASTLDCDRGPLGLKRRICSSRTASAKGTSPFLLVEALPTLREPKDDLLLFLSSSLQSSRNRTRSPIAVTPRRSISSSLIDCTIEGTILSRRNTTASVSRFSSVKMSSIFSRFNKAKRNVFWEPGDDHNEVSTEYNEVSTEYTEVNTEDNEVNTERLNHPV